MSETSENIDLQEGLRQSAAGETVSLGSFAKYADDIDLAELERLAKAATPGKRSVEGSLISAREASIGQAFGVNWRNDQAFIAATDPGTVLALLARVREAEARIEKMVRLRDRIELVRDEVEDLAHDVRETLSILNEGDEQ